MPGFTVGTYDYGANNKQNLLAAINAENGTDYTLDGYDFTEPKRITIPNSQYNTSIKLGPRAATGKIGFKTIYYNRIHATELGPLKITWQNEVFLTELLPRLSEKYGISLTVDDLYEQRIVPPVLPETEVSLTLNFKETSVAYYGGTFIVLGAVDPAIEFEIPQTLPFKNDLIFYVNSFVKTNDGRNYLESSVLSVASDKLRSRTINVTATEANSWLSIVKNTYDNDSRNKLEQYLPFVFSWTFGDTMIVRGVNIYGEVIEVNETSNSVEKKANLFTLDVLNTSALENARTKILVREGTQAADGSIYLLVGDPINEKVNLFKSADFGDSFEIVDLTTTNMASFNYANWEDVVIHDFLVVGKKLSILVSSPNTYGVNPLKGSKGPAVEEFNLTTGVSDYFPINPEFVTNTNFSIVFNEKSKMRFVSTEIDESILDVVAIARTSATLEPIIVYCNRQPLMEFTTEVLGARFLDKPIYGLAAYSKPLSKTNVGKFVAVEILTMVPTNKSDDFFLIETNQRNENSYLGYGIVTISSIRKGNKLGGWNENFVDIGGGSQPVSVTVTNKGRRNHYTFSGSNGIFRVKFEETAPNVFDPTLDKVFDVGSHPGFSLECDIGNGAYVIPEVFEDATNIAIFKDLSNEESLKPPIGFSFITNNSVTDSEMWLVAVGENSALEERVFGDEYRHLGKTPMAVFTDASSNIYAWTADQGIYKSTDQGNSWTDYCSAKSYYSNEDYFGSSNIRLKALDFKALSVSNNITYAQLNPIRTLGVFNKKTVNPDYTLNLSDNVIYRLDGTKPAGGPIINTAFLTTDLNNTSAFSPRSVIGWDTDTNNNLRALAKFTEDGTAKVINQLAIPMALEASAFDVYCDVGFFDLKAIVLTRDDTAGANLYFVKNDDSIVRHGLMASVTPDFNTFDPKCILPLWDGSVQDITYTPILILSESNDVLVLERDGLGGNTITVRLLNVAIPDDNSKPIKWFSMFNSNRRDKLAFQEGNGIFKVIYAWDGATTSSQITLEKIFDTSTININNIYSGCQFNLPNVTPFSEAVIGTWPAHGTVLADDCVGFNKRNKIADGFGGYFWTTIKVNSEECGYVEPAPGGVGEGGANVNIGP